MQTRTRLLLALIGVSIMFLIDLGVNGSSVIKTFTDRTVQVTPVDFKGWHISEDTPFLRKEGRQTQGGEGLKAIRVVGGGDIEVRRSTTGEVVLYYDVRTYGLSRRHAEPFHELVDVTST